MAYQLNQIYDSNLVLKETLSKDVSILHQQRNQRSGIEKKIAITKKRIKDRRERIAANQKMAAIISIAKKNIAAGNIIKVGV